MNNELGRIFTEYVVPHLKILAMYLCAAIEENHTNPH
jgi:hypothetical protein